jgi:hypothetical protein
MLRNLDAYGCVAGGMRRLRAASALAAALLIALTGCARSDETTSAGPSAGTVSIVVDRIGGNVPVNDHVVVNPDGSWTATNNAGQSRSGQLSAEQTTAVYKIVTSPAFASEAAQPTAAQRCIDAPTVTITAGDTKVTFVDCMDSSTPPTAAQLLHVVQEKILT